MLLERILRKCASSFSPKLRQQCLNSKPGVLCEKPELYLCAAPFRQKICLFRRIISSVDPQNTAIDKKLGCFLNMKEVYWEQDSFQLTLGWSKPSPFSLIRFMMPSSLLLVMSSPSKLPETPETSMSGIFAKTGFFDRKKKKFREIGDFASACFS